MLVVEGEVSREVMFLRLRKEVRGRKGVAFCRSGWMGDGIYGMGFWDLGKRC